jgi:acyl-CoA synthetase (AMP-forming)/AMP-acid ligase II
MTAHLSTDVSTLPDLLLRRAGELPDAPFLRHANARWTYGEFGHRVTQVAAGLREAGVGKGDVVGVILRNGPEYLEVWWGILWLGAVFNPVNPDLTGREAAGILSDSGATTVICTEEAAAALREHDLPALRRVITDIDSLRGSGTVGEPEPIEPEALASLVYTSGTTGRPKGAMLSHANCLADTWMLAELAPVGRGDVMGMVLPLFHVNAQVVTTMVPLLIGAQTAMWERFSASTFWATVAEFEPVTFSAVPTMLAALLHAPGADEAETNTVRFVICGAAPLSPALFHRFEEKFGIAILEGYGLTEGSCTSTLNPWHGPRKIGSIGIPTRGQEVVIMDEQGKELPDGERGEVCVRGPNVMQGYYNRPDATAETLRDGWLHTGDVGYRDEDGFFFLVDRKKDMIIRGGENIYPREIEDVLLEHASVQGAAVIGRPDEVRGEEVHAVLVLAEGAELEEIERHCRERLAPFKVPSTWQVVDELPKTSTGKIDKKPLRESLVV